MTLPDNVLNLRNCSLAVVIFAHYANRRTWVDPENKRTEKQKKKSICFFYMMYLSILIDRIRA